LINEVSGRSLPGSPSKINIMIAQTIPGILYFKNIRNIKPGYGYIPVLIIF
jgi:hypothetical protein